MFTYLDPSVRERLIAEGTFQRIDAEGEPISPNAAVPEDSVALNLLGPIPLPLQLPSFNATVKWYASVRSSELSTVDSLARDLRAGGGQHLFSHLVSSMAVNSVLVIGEPTENPLVRVHSNCLTGDVFGSQRCDCGPQLDAALERIGNDPAGGYVIYMAGHEGRGIGLWAKAATYLLQDAGQDTYQANRSLGLPDDSRDFSDAAILIKRFIGEAPFRLLSNNPKKLHDLSEHGLHNITAVKHIAAVSSWNKRYLNAKRGWGHHIDEDDLNDGE